MKESVGQKIANGYLDAKVLVNQIFNGDSSAEAHSSRSVTSMAVAIALTIGVYTFFALFGQKVLPQSELGSAIGTFSLLAPSLLIGPECARQLVRLDHANTRPNK